jgi:hypothetical protein
LIGGHTDGLFKTTRWCIDLHNEKVRTVGLELCHADVGHRDLLEQVWRSDDRGGISRQFGSELRMPECSPVVSGRFPDGIVEIRRAFAKSAVKLGGDEARLTAPSDQHACEYMRGADNVIQARWQLRSGPQV